MNWFNTLLGSARLGISIYVIESVIMQEEMKITVITTLIKKKF